MIKKEDLKDIGVFRKTHALKGEINAQLDIDMEFLDEDYPLIILVEGIAVPFFIEEWRPKTSTVALVKLEDVDYEEACKDFVNQPIYALKKDLADFYDVEENDLLQEDNLIGMMVYDEEGEEIGEVIDFDSSTINELLIIKNKDNESPVYLPFVDDMIVSISPEDNRITARIPDGLLEINNIID
ncbi:MAG: ribosome maturation factor RimM [Muribaculaceae bacterium]|nr:ribosome maturation factor RimM [Muribaculaceae bacterium]